MKKIINVCVCFFVCLSLFLFPVSASAEDFTFCPFSFLLYNNNSLVSTYGPLNAWNNVYQWNNIPTYDSCVIRFDLGDNAIVEGYTYNISFKCLSYYYTSFSTDILFRFGTGGDWYQSNSYSYNANDYNVVYTGNLYAESDFSSVEFKFPFNRDLMNFGASNIYLSITPTNKSFSVINSDISNINTTVSNLSSSVGILQNDFVNLNTDLSEGADAVVGAIGGVSAGIGTLNDTIESGIGTIFGGITTLISNSGSIKDMVRSIADSVASLDLNFLNWWNEYISNYTYVLMALNNINSTCTLYGGAIVDNLSVINSSLYNCTNAVTSSMNAMNRDIQEQMIAQGNGINSSIKTMETAIVTKLNDTLVVNDKTGIQNNDTVNVDLDSAINDYDSVEQGLVTDFNDSLDSLDTDSASNIYNQNDFVRTTTFISTNMQNIYESNDFIGGFIDLTLLLGLIFIVIGIGVK